MTRRRRGVTPGRSLADVWPGVVPARAVAVVAHPDDESFGLGAVLAALVDAGTEVTVVCLTRGEASTLGAAADLADIRDAELRAAASVLGVAHVQLFDFADGALPSVDSAQLDALVDAHVQGADLVVVFEPGGVTGHPDHRAATAVAARVAARRGIAVLEWGVSPAVARSLRAELGVPFVFLGGDGDGDGHGDGPDIDIEVSRTRQLAAIACHGSQANANPVLARRLALQGATERVRYVAPPAATARGSTGSSRPRPSVLRWCRPARRS